MVTEFDLEYNLACPECAADGEQSQLGLIAGEGIRCNGPRTHSFEELPGQALEKPAVRLAERVSALSAAHGSEEASEANALTAVVNRDPRALMRAPAQQDCANSAAESEADQSTKPADAEKLFSGMLWQPVDIGGGDVVMLCRFSEAHIQMLKAEADNQKQTLGEYMLEWLWRAESNQWI